MTKFLILILALAFSGCSRATCIQYKTVKTLGGCDKRGECGVSYEEGGFDTQLLPTVGQRFCIKYSNGVDYTHDD